LVNKDGTPWSGGERAYDKDTGRLCEVGISQEAMLSPWPTPNAGPQNDTDTKWEARREECKERHGNNGFGMTLGMASSLASWATPATRDYKGGSSMPPSKMDGIGLYLDQMALLTVSGPTPSGSPAGTEKRGQLNPDFSLWLMGIPAEWALYAPRETPSALRKLKNLSAPPSTRCANWSDDAGTCIAAHCRFPDCDPSMKGKA